MLIGSAIFHFLHGYSRIHAFTHSYLEFFLFFVFGLFLSCQVKEDAMEAEVEFFYFFVISQCPL